MFSRRVPLGDLIDLCRILRHQVGAGMTLQQVLKKQGQQGRRSFRDVCTRLSDALLNGSSLSDALDREKDVFPVLFLSLVKLGEATGHLAEIFGELERYYQLELQLRRQFRTQIFLPVVQFVAAIAVVAGLLVLLGIIAEITRTKPIFTLFGLGGCAGASAFLGVVFGTLIGFWLLYGVISSIGQQKAWMDRFLLATPALGPCLLAIVMSRFTLALQLTLDSELPIGKALRLSLEATGNAHFAGQADGIVLALKNGRTLHEALVDSKLFPSDFLDMVLSSETSGSVPEMMKHLAVQYQEEAGRRMTFLTKAAGFLVWLCVAGFIIWAIFRIASIYLGALGGAI